MEARIEAKGSDMARVSRRRDSGGNRVRKLAAPNAKMNGRFLGIARSHGAPFLVSLAIGAMIVLVINQEPPMIPTDGVITAVDANGTPLHRPVLPGDRVQISWTQNWNHLCPITAHPLVAVGSSRKSDFEPIELLPPDKNGVRLVNRIFQFPYIVAGDATYKAQLEPHCWVDKIYQRKYYSPEVSFKIGELIPPSAAPSGSVPATGSIEQKHRLK